MSNMAFRKLIGYDNKGNSMYQTPTDFRCPADTQIWRLSQCAWSNNPNLPDKDPGYADELQLQLRGLVPVRRTRLVDGVEGSFRA